MPAVSVRQGCDRRRDNFSASSPTIPFKSRRRLRNSSGICAAYTPAASIFSTAWSIRSSKTNVSSKCFACGPITSRTCPPLMQIATSEQPSVFHPDRVIESRVKPLPVLPGIRPPQQRIAADVRPSLYHHTRIRVLGIGLHQMPLLTESHKRLARKAQLGHSALDPPVAPFLLKVIHIVGRCHEPGVV